MSYTVIQIDLLLLLPIISIGKIGFNRSDNTWLWQRYQEKIWTKIQHDQRFDLKIKNFYKTGFCLYEAPVSS